MRVLSGAPLGSGIPTASRSSIAVSCPALGRAVVGADRLRDLVADPVDGFSGVIGSWKIIAIPYPGGDISRSSVAATRSRPP